MLSFNPTLKLEKELKLLHSKIVTANQLDANILYFQQLFFL